MTLSSTNAVQDKRPRLRLWGAVAIFVTLLALGVWLGWYRFVAGGERHKALELAGQNQFSEAEGLLQNIYARQPQDANVVRALALGYVDARRFAEAEIFLDRWCELRPQDLEPHRRRFDLSMKQQKIALARNDAAAILQLQPDDFETRHMLVQMLLLDGRYEEAEQEALRCLQAQPNNAELWFMLASVYRGEGRTAQAAEVADRLLRDMPDFPGAAKLRADLYLDAKQNEPAIHLLRQAGTRPGPGGIAALYDLSVALARAGRKDEARQTLAEMQWRRAMAIWAEDEHRDDSPGLQSRVVEALLAAGKIEDAVRFLTEILKRNPNAPAGTHELLTACYEKQKTDKGTGRQGDKETKPR